MIVLRKYRFIWITLLCIVGLITGLNYFINQQEKINQDDFWVGSSARAMLTFPTENVMEINKCISRKDIPPQYSVIIEPGRIIFSDLNQSQKYLWLRRENFDSKLFIFGGGPIPSGTYYTISNPGDFCGVA